MSLGELIRDSLEAALSVVSRDAEKDSLFENVIYDGPAPVDGSSDHDKYLYDQEPQGSV